SQGRIMLPWSVFAANGVGESEIFSGRDSEGVTEALGQFAEMAGEHLDKADMAIALLPARLRPAFASTAVLRRQLALLDRKSGPFAPAPSGPFAPAPDEADWRKILRLAWWSWRSR